MMLAAHSLAQQACGELTPYREAIFQETLTLKASHITLSLIAPFYLVGGLGEAIRRNMAASFWWIATNI